MDWTGSGAGNDPILREDRIPTVGRISADVVPAPVDMNPGFLGWDFRGLDLNRALALEPWLECHPQPLSGYTVATLAAWNGIYHYSTVVSDGTLLIACRVGGPAQHLLQPLGEFSQATQTQVLEGAARLDYPLTIYGVSPQFVAEHPEFCSSAGKKAGQKLPSVRPYSS